jgi:hypothetical protein
MMHSQHCCLRTRNHRWVYSQHQHQQRQHHGETVWLHAACVRDHCCSTHSLLSRASLLMPCSSFERSTQQDLRQRRRQQPQPQTTQRHSLEANPWLSKQASNSSSSTTRCACTCNHTIHGSYETPPETGGAGVPVVAKDTRFETLKIENSCTKYRCASHDVRSPYDQELGVRATARAAVHMCVCG